MKRNTSKLPILKKVAIASSLLVATLTLGVLAPFLLSDGSGAYVGVKKEVAQLGIDRINSTTDSMSDPFFMRAYVKSVFDSPPRTGECLSATPYSSDPTQTEHYGAEIGYRTIFGLEYKSVNYFPCQEPGRQRVSKYNFFVLATQEW